MPIDVQRIFASVGLRSGDRPAFAPPPPPSGDLDAAEALGGAAMRRFRAVADAVDTTTRALVERGAATRELGGTVLAGGAGVSRILADIRRRKREIRDRHEAATARVNFIREADDIGRRAIAEADPAGTGAAARAAGALRDLRRRTLEDLDVADGDVRRSLDDQIAMVATRTIVGVRDRAARIENRFLVGELEKRAAAYRAQASRRRGGAQEQLLAIGIGDVRDAVAEGLIDADAGERKIAALRVGVLADTIEADADEDPAAALARLRDGGYAHLFANEAEKAVAVRAIEREIETRRRVAAQRLAGLTEDHVASIRATGRGIRGLRVRIETLAPRMLANFDERAAGARAYHDAMTELRWADPRTADDALAAAPPESRRAALEAFADRQRALAGDPYAYAAGHPSGRTREGNIAVQKSLGVADYSCMSRAEAARLAAAWNEQSDAGKIETLAAWSDRAGRHHAAFMRDLDRAGLPAHAKVLAMHADEPRMRAVLARTVAARHEGAKALEKALGGGVEVEALRRDVRSGLSRFQASLAATGPGGAETAGDVLDTVYGLALSYAVEGVGAFMEKGPARRAADELINDHFGYRDRYRVPARFDADAIKAHADTLVERRLAASGPPDDARDRRRGGYWANTPDGDGLTFLRPDGAPETDGRGRELRFRFRDVPAVRTPSAPARARVGLRGGDGLGPGPLERGRRVRLAGGETKGPPEEATP